MVCDRKTSGEWKGDSMRNRKWKSRVAMALCVAMTGILVGCGATGEEESSVDMSRGRREKHNCSIKLW